MCRVLLALFTCTVGAYTVGTIEATLSPFLDSMDITVITLYVDSNPVALCANHLAITSPANNLYTL